MNCNSVINQLVLRSSPSHLGNSLLFQDFIFDYNASIRKEKPKKQANKKWNPFFLTQTFSGQHWLLIKCYQVNAGIFQKVSTSNEKTIKTVFKEKNGMKCGIPPLETCVLIGPPSFRWETLDSFMQHDVQELCRVVSAFSFF